jgi:hypothetical protein
VKTPQLKRSVCESAFLLEIGQLGEHIGFALFAQAEALTTDVDERRSRQ